MNSRTEDGVWKAVLALKDFLKPCINLPEKIFLDCENGCVTANKEGASVIISGEKDRDNSHFWYDDRVEIHPGNGLIDKKLREFLILYLPVCFSCFKAREKNSAYTIAHFAQTLDGRIATQNGDSKWIGNEENLIHAHRMRALCDGVLIGSGTLKSDNPQLNVRHVEGNNPARIIVGNSPFDYKSVNNSPGRVIIIHSEGERTQPDLEELIVDEHDGFMNCHTMLRKLHETGIHSIYIEGGSFTSSAFLNQGALDIIQLHIAPIIVGTGIPTFSLSPVSKLGEAISFEEFEFFNIGKEVMFCGKVNRS